MACKKMHMHMSRMAMHRKLHILRTLTKSKSVKKGSIVMDAYLHIYKLRLQVAAIQEVRVEKLPGVTGYLRVRISCKKTENLLVSILETFEEMHLIVVQANLTSKHLFAMEAIVKAVDDMDASILNRAILKVID